jgi:hypothetical protein
MWQEFSFILVFEGLPVVAQAGLTLNPLLQSL